MVVRLMPRLSVIIVNYNTRDLLRACLQSLMQQTLPANELEIIVVDNASPDGSATMVAEVFPQVRLLAFMDEHPDYAGCTAQMRYPDGSIQRTCSRVPTLAYLFVKHTPLTLFATWRNRLDAQHWYSQWDRTSDYDVEVIPGSCTLMRREDILLDEDLLLYYPEDDLAQRTQRTFRYLRAAQITHHEKSATQNWGATAIYYRDLRVYVRKHHGWLAMAALWLMSRPLYWGMWVKQQVKQTSSQ